MAVQGLWNIGGFNLPDFGISEKLSSLTGGLVGNYIPNNANVNPGLTANAPYGFNPTPSQQQNILTNPGLSNPTTYAPSVLGASTSVSNPAAPVSNPAAPKPTTTSGGGNSSGISAAQAANNAYLSSLNNQYDYNVGNLNSQIGQNQNQLDQSLASLDTAQQGLLSTAEQQKQDAVNSGAQRQAEAGNIAAQNVKTTRNVLRALGILNSSYAGDKLTQPGQEFEKARAAIQSETANRVNQIDQFVAQKKSEYVNTVAGLKNQFANIVDQIQRDLRFTDRQRADAVNAANAAFQDKISQVQQGASKAINDATAAKQNFIASLVSSQLGNNPELLTNPALTSQFFTNASGLANNIYGPKQVGVAGPQGETEADRIKRLQGLGQYSTLSGSGV